MTHTDASTKILEKIAELVNSINESEFEYLRNTHNIHELSEAIKDLSIAYTELFKSHQV